MPSRRTIDVVLLYNKSNTFGLAKDVEQCWAARNAHSIGQPALNNAGMIGGGRVGNKRQHAALKVHSRSAARRRGRGVLGEVGGHG